MYNTYKSNTTLLRKEFYKSSIKTKFNPWEHSGIRIGNNSERGYSSAVFRLLSLPFYLIPTLKDLLLLY